MGGGDQPLILTHCSLEETSNLLSPVVREEQPELLDVDMFGILTDDSPLRYIGFDQQDDSPLRYIGFDQQGCPSSMVYETPNGGCYWCLDVSSQLKPTVGKIYLSWDEVYKMHETYGEMSGFGIREISQQLPLRMLILSVKAAHMALKRDGGKEWASASRKIAEKKAEFAKLEAIDCGKPLDEAAWYMYDVDGCFEYNADLAEALDAKQNASIDLTMDTFTYSVTSTYISLQSHLRQITAAYINVTVSPTSTYSKLHRFTSM
ncbi:hypothetical protein E3N88_15451 [Mikania micrantha]|uniref:Uncharacterized protein n=1 Tax=Mikania micrantha TaxID=192012 RepID=A0A5N6NX96_9ASTR|nr:hypothetical protein E3N88_15451 [Mikania micrantha]